MASSLVHASCIALDGCGFLLRGRSGAGKSDLALRLIDCGAVLVADDQTRLSVRDRRLMARAPAALAGKLEVRGIGILEFPFLAETEIHVVVELVPSNGIERLPEPHQVELLGISLPLLRIDPLSASASAKLRLAAARPGTLKLPSRQVARGKVEASVSVESNTKEPVVSEADARRRGLVLVTGMSGAGRTSALKVLEDQGYEAIDNLPLSFLAAVTADRDEQRPLAIGIDTRTRRFAVDPLLEQLDALNGDGRSEVVLVFVDCDDDVLARRYTETRRRHPMALDRPVADGIKAERRLVTPLRARADIVIDTSALTPADLRALLGERLGLSDAPGMVISVTSFSFRFGLPREADLVLDVRFLANPHYDPALRPLTGQDPAVATYVESDPDFPSFFGNLTTMLEPLLPRFEREGKSYLTVAIGCTGGRHRSVATAERLAAWLEGTGRQVRLNHRDVERCKGATASQGKDES